MTLSGNTRQFQSARVKLIDGLLVKLSKRFEADEELLGATAVADLDKWPVSNVDEPGNITVKTRRFM